jgi:hypothetical protein
MCNLCKQLRPTGGKYKGGGGKQSQVHGEDEHCLHDYFVICKQHFYVSSINMVTMTSKMRS